MSRAYELVSKLQDVLDEIESETKRLTNENSKLDVMREDVLHLIENSSLNANQGYKCSKALQLISKERRIIKVESELMRSLYDRVESCKPTIQDAKTKLENKTAEKVKMVERGASSYTPRIISSLDRDEILNNVVKLLTEE